MTQPEEPLQLANQDMIDSLHVRNRDWTQQQLSLSRKRIHSLVSQGKLPKDNVRLLHRTNAQREHAEHEQAMSRRFKLPQRDPDEYEAQLKAIADQYGIQLPDHRKQPHQDASTVALFVRVFNDAFQTYKEHATLKRTL